MFYFCCSSVSWFHYITGVNYTVPVGNLLKFFEILFKFEDKILGPKSEESKPLLK